MNHLQQAVQRVLNVSWIISWPERRSNGLLLREFLRRMQYWIDYHQISTSEFPLIDLAEILKIGTVIPATVVNDMHSYLGCIHPYCERLGDLDDIYPVLPSPVIQTCLYYLHWSCIDWSSHHTYIHFPDPYEPLIRFYERGGIFDYQQGGLVTITGWTSIKLYQNNNDLNKNLLLDDIHLNSIDNQED